MMVFPNSVKEKAKSIQENMMATLMRTLLWKREKSATKSTIVWFKYKDFTIRSSFYFWDTINHQIDKVYLFVEPCLGGCFQEISISLYKIISHRLIPGASYLIQWNVWYVPIASYIIVPNYAASAFGWLSSELKVPPWLTAPSSFLAPGVTSFLLKLLATMTSHSL